MGKMGRKRKSRIEVSGLGFAPWSVGNADWLLDVRQAIGASMSPCPDFFLMYNIVGTERYQKLSPLSRLGHNLLLRLPNNSQLSMSLFIPVMPTFIPLSVSQEPDNLSDINFTLHLFLVMVMPSCTNYSLHPSPPPLHLHRRIPPVITYTPYSTALLPNLTPFPLLVIAQQPTLLFNRPTIKSPSLLSFPVQRNHPLSHPRLSLLLTPLPSRSHLFLPSSFHTPVLHPDTHSLLPKHTSYQNLPLTNAISSWQGRIAESGHVGAGKGQEGGGGAGWLMAGLKS